MGDGIRINGRQVENILKGIGASYGNAAITTVIAAPAERALAGLLGEVSERTGAPISVGIDTRLGGLGNQPIGVRSNVQTRPDGSVVISGNGYPQNYGSYNTPGFTPPGYGQRPVQFSSDQNPQILQTRPELQLIDLAADIAVAARNNNPALMQQKADEFAVLVKSRLREDGGLRVDDLPRDTTLSTRGGVTMPHPVGQPNAVAASLLRALNAPESAYAAIHNAYQAHGVTTNAATKLPSQAPAATAGTPPAGITGALPSTAQSPEAFVVAAVKAVQEGKPISTDGLKTNAAGLLVLPKLSKPYETGVLAADNTTPIVIELKSDIALTPENMQKFIAARLAEKGIGKVPAQRTSEVAQPPAVASTASVGASPSADAPSMQTVAYNPAPREKDHVDLSIRMANANDAPAKRYSNIGEADMPRGLKQSQVTDLQHMLKKAGYDIGNTGPQGDGVDNMFGKKCSDRLKEACAKAKLDFATVFDKPETILKLQEHLNAEAKAHAPFKAAPVRQMDAQTPAATPVATAPAAATLSAAAALGADALASKPGSWKSNAPADARANFQIENLVSALLEDPKEALQIASQLRKDPAMAATLGTVTVTGTDGKEFNLNTRLAELQAQQAPERNVAQAPAGMSLAAISDVAAAAQQPAGNSFTVPVASEVVARHPGGIGTRIPDSGTLLAELSAGLGFTRATVDGDAAERAQQQRLAQGLEGRLQAQSAHIDPMALSAPIFTVGADPVAAAASR